MNKNTAIIVTVLTVLCCGCPGIFLCGFGGATSAGIMPYTTEINGVTDQGILPATYGYVMLCLSLIFIAIPIVVGVVTLRKKPEEVPFNNEPLPPVS